MMLIATFMKTRAIAFTVILLLSLLWTILLCVESSTTWDVSDYLQRNLILFLILVNSVTAMSLPALLLFDFFWWLDAASVALLFLVNLAIAVVFTLANSKFTCSDLSANCKTVNIVILAFSWINPVLLLSYAVWLAVAIYWRLHYAGPPESLRRKSELPMMLPPDRDSALTATVVPPDGGLPLWTSSAQRGTRNSTRRTLSTVMEEESSSSPRSGRSSRRLSKRLPKWFY